MEKFSLSARQFYSSILQRAGSFSGGWLRGSVVTVARSFRDIDEDGSKLFSETYLATATSLSKVGSAAALFEAVKAVVSDISPSGRVSVSFRHGGKTDDVPMILVNHANAAAAPLYLDVSELHGKFVGDTWFGGLSWSSDERYVAYVAHKKPPSQRTKDATALFEARSPAVLSDASKFEFTDDWGEKYVGLVATSLHVLDTRTGDVSTVTDIDEAAWTVGQPVFMPDPTGTGAYRLAYTAWRAGNRKLGMIYCYQRDSATFLVDLTTHLVSTAQGAPTGVKLSHRLVSAGLKLARSPRFSPSGGTVVFLGSRNGFLSHNGCSELFKCAVGGGKIGEVVTVVDVVSNPLNSGSGKVGAFAGLYTDRLSNACFVGERTVLLTSACGSVEALYAVDIDGTTKDVHVQRLLGDAPHAWTSCSLLDVSPDTDTAPADKSAARALLVLSSPADRPRLCVLPVTVTVGAGVGLVQQGDLVECLESAELAVAASRRKVKAPAAPSDGTHAPPTPPADGADSNAAHGLTREKFTRCPLPPRGNEGAPRDPITWKVNSYTGADGIPYESILMVPTAAAGANAAPLPLIVVPHGGPHSVIPTMYIASYAYLCLYLGAAVLQVNYRGSTGFGRDSIDALTGSIGTKDVADVVACTRDVIDSMTWASLGLGGAGGVADGARVAVVGGSHGGFLASHLIGQHPDLFKVACMRNPVTDLPGMLSTTDIIDWCYLEALGPTDAYQYLFRPDTDPANPFGRERVYTPMPSDQHLSVLRSVSPIIHVGAVKAPTLMLIGAKDRRVPQSQGISYYHTLRSLGVTTKMLVFPEDVHAIDRPQSEAEQWVAIAEWLMMHL